MAVTNSRSSAARRIAARGVFVVVLTMGAGSAFALSAAAGTESDARVANAAEARNTTAVLALVKQRAEVNAAQPDGATALHWAAHWNDLEMTRALLGAGANPNAANDYGVTPLFLAST